MIHLQEGWGGGREFICLLAYLLVLIEACVDGQSLSQLVMRRMCGLRGMLGDAGGKGNMCRWCGREVPDVDGWVDESRS